MFAASLRSDASGSVALGHIRVRGGVDVSFAVSASRTRAVRVHEADGFRVRFPAGTDPLEAVVLNTGGGVAGGDSVTLAFAAGAGASAVVTTVAAERVYRALDRPASLAVRLRLGAASTLSWLPQETILSDGAGFVRTLDVDMAADARLLTIECTVFGRRGSGERMARGALSERWTIRRDGALAHIEAVRLDGAVDALMQRAAIGGGAHVTGLLVYVATDAADRLDAVRAAIAEYSDCAASAWAGKLVLRALGSDTMAVKRSLGAAVGVLTGQPLPRTWQM